MKSKIQRKAAMMPALIHTPETVIPGKDEIHLKVIVLILIEEEYFVAYCPSLQLSSYAKTQDEAKSAFDEALKIFLAETLKRGTLEKLLLKYGWTLKQTPTLRYTQPPVPQELLHSAQSVSHERISIPY